MRRAFNRPLCSRPVLIFNRRAIRLVLASGRYIYDGHLEIVPNLRKWTDDFPTGRFLRYAYQCASVKLKDKDGNVYFKYDYERLEKFYVEFDGCFEYLFLVVHCRKCPICVESRRNDICSRCLFESQMSDCAPIFVTLTYAPEYLPHKRTQVEITDDYKIKRDYYFRHPTVDGRAGSGDVWLRDLQLFFKRLRKFFESEGKDTGFRYIAAGELGHNTKRPHYHIIFYRLPYKIKSPSDFRDIALLKVVILHCWRMCMPQSCTVEVARDASRYVTKYLTKDVSDNSGFIVSSRGGNGFDKGLGYSFIRKFDYLFELCPETSCLSFVDKWTGQSVSLTIGSYALRYLLPSYSILMARYHSSYLGDYRNLCHRLSLIASVVSCKLYRSLFDYRVVQDAEIMCHDYNFAKSYCYSTFSIYNKVDLLAEFNQAFPDSILYSRDDINIDHVCMLLDFLVSDLQQFINYFVGRYHVIDDGYYMYLDGLRHRYLDSLPSRVVNDDLILGTENEIVKRNYLNLQNEIF